MKVLSALRTAGPSRCLGDHVKWRFSRNGKIESQLVLLSKIDKSRGGTLVARAYIKKSTYS